MPKYNEEDMRKAVEACKKGEALRSTANLWKVDRATLRRKVQGLSVVGSRRGPRPIFSKENEAILSKWLADMAKSGFPVTKELLLYSAAKLAKELNVEFPRGNPGRKWFELFLKRHPHISQRVSQTLTPSRSSIEKRHIEQWFHKVERDLENYPGILNFPDRIFNTDETAFFLNPTGKKVLAPKGTKNIYLSGANDEKENITVLVTVSASGEVAPPMVVLKYSRVPKQIVESLPPSWSVGRSDSGWMTHETFYEYMANVFNPWLIKNNVEKPVIFFMDGHTSHISQHLAEFCAQNGIILIALLPNATHLLQPLDVAVFHSVKVNWRNKVNEWRMANGGRYMKRTEFGSILSSVIECITPQIIKSGFRKSGLYPWSVNAVSLPFEEKTDGRLEKEGTRKAELETFFNVLEKEIGRYLEAFLKNAASLQDEWKGEEEAKALYELWYRTKISLELGDQSRASYSDDQIPDTLTPEPGPSTTRERSLSPGENFGPQFYPEVIMSSTPSPAAIEQPIENEPGNTICEEASCSEFVTPKKRPALFLKEEVPSPFKRALFWPGEQQKKKKQKKVKLPAVMTSKDALLYFKKKQEEKDNAEREKQKRKQLREEKKAEKEEKKKTANKEKRKADESDSTSSPSPVTNLQGSGESSWDESSGQEEDCATPLLSSLKEGDFVLVEFLGGKRNATKFIYLCTITHKKKNGIEVTGFKAIDAKKKEFVLDEKDVSLVDFKQIKGVLNPPDVRMTGHRIKYVFEKKVPVLEKM